ncbi:MAG: transcriptional regulator [Synechococcaceae cyanobacterium SM2_3_2]|nr:transcriptional regulator [Synechococcaceae cyanobacterium SM2_3_2]
MIRSFLHEVKSDLYEMSATLPFSDLCRQLNITDGGTEYLKPRNVGLIFFHESPQDFFPGSQIDIVYFPNGVAGKNYLEKICDGPLDQQIRDALAYIRAIVIREKVIKRPNQAESQRIYSYPFSALEEALVNAVYHRSYERQEPIEVRIESDRITILSYPGPDPSIRLDDLRAGRIRARRYRNRRIGGFLKELGLTEGRATGIPTIMTAMQSNGSPPPVFDADEGRTYFLVELLIHPDIQAEDHVEDHVDLTQTESQILTLLRSEPTSRKQVADVLGYEGRSGNMLKAIERLMSLGLIEWTIPDKPRSRNQKLRITANGQQLIEHRKTNNVRYRLD